MRAGICQAPETRLRLKGRCPEMPAAPGGSARFMAGPEGPRSAFVRLSSSRPLLHKGYGKEKQRRGARLLLSHKTKHALERTAWGKRIHLCREGGRCPPAPLSARASGADFSVAGEGGGGYPAQKGDFHQEEACARAFALLVGLLRAYGAFGRDSGPACMKG